MTDKEEEVVVVEEEKLVETDVPKETKKASSKEAPQEGAKYDGGAIPK
jgi:hypothetical protein